MPVLLGRYRLGATLGSGGMAEVRRAEDLALGRPVAVKLLHPHLAADPAFMARFDREARLAAGLSDPRVVAVFDRGVADDGRPFLVMELVEGESLAELLRRVGPLPPDRALAVADDVLAALEHAHGRGVVHRDVKPHNVLLDGEGRAKLADFGIAQAVAAAAVTVPGEMLGSLRYVAPERLAGAPGSPAGDLYGLGAVLYEALTGRAPFDGDHPAAIAAQHATGTPAPPSAVRPGLPRWLDAALLRALAREPDDRFPSAAAMRAALRPRAAAVDAPTVPFTPVPVAGAPSTPASASASRGAHTGATPTIRGAGGAPVVLAAAAILVAATAFVFASRALTWADGGQPAAAPKVAAPTVTATRPAPSIATPAPTRPATAAPPSPTAPRPATATARPTVPPTATPRPTARSTATAAPPTRTAAAAAGALARLRELVEEAAPAGPKPGRGNADRSGDDATRALLERLDEAQRLLSAGRLEEARAEVRALAARVVSDAARGRIDRRVAARILAELRELADL
jgi:hypothetical protein